MAGQCSFSPLVLNRYTVVRAICLFCAIKGLLSLQNQNKGSLVHLHAHQLSNIFTDTLIYFCVHVTANVHIISCVQKVQKVDANTKKKKKKCCSVFFLHTDDTVIKMSLTHSRYKRYLEYVL